MWTFALNGSQNENLTSSDTQVVDGWEDVGCEEKLSQWTLCEVGLPGRVEERNALRIKPAGRERFDRALAKGHFKEFQENIVSVSANIDNKDFLEAVNITKQEFVPLFDCRTGNGGPRYISYLFVCDGVDDCNNKRDEILCVYKPRDPVSCGGVSCCDGYCLPLHRVGDGDVDCTVCGKGIEDLNDENYESLKLDENFALFWDDGSNCANFSKLNDNITDCTGPEGPLDETIGKLETVDTCQKVLDHRVWIPRCVYVRDSYGGLLGCKDMSHLENCADFECPEGYFKCPNTYCIPQHYVLDGTVDCPEGEEENIYTIGVCTGNFACRDSKVCLHPDLVCDGHPDCPSRDDEVDCQVTCPEGLRCILGTVVVSDYSKRISADSLHSLEKTTRYLNLSHVDLSVSNFSFFISSNIVVFVCSHCQIQSLNDNFLEYTRKLELLDISYNQIHRLDREDYLSALKNIRHLNVSYNRHLVEMNIYKLMFLETLDLSHTSMYQIDKSFISSFQSLKHLNLSYTHITNIHKNTFSPQNILETLNLRGLVLKDFREDFFNGLTVSQGLYTDSFELCCPQITGENILPYDCHAPDDAISSCLDLVGVVVQRVLLWIVAVLAVLGNTTVVVYRVIWDRSVLKTGYGLLVTNLGISDFIMGVYLFIIAGANYYLRGVYVLFERSWRESCVCRLAGFLATLSCETSTLFVFLITLERFLVMKYPFDHDYFSKLTNTILLPLSWIIGLLLALTPIVFQFEIFSSNAMCLGLPLSTERFTGWEFSFAVFIVLNLCVFLLIAYGQIAIFRAISENRQSQTPSRRAKDITVVKQLSLVALSNFLCWFPVGLMGILSLSGHKISKDVYAWTTVIVLPINSAANPLLYTIPALMVRWKRFKHGETRPTRPTSPSVVKGQ